ncbi:metallophosphoesterase family protein [Campylobacter corcagiensis]|uniref:Metallophosphoesterase n=1 Tax=Campylobacter corcagiensis TaxID=1448857 RepID=A0A7M1LEJ3_9BACT|nr:metallophosphoesterase family protein [Campylobacter corcagiensis]QKF64849.1 metallophosphoesterase [Campylobacter corcagiensis]QOQ86989.1 metallophosphoesterase [Campylobacter corcagiensis]
MLLLCGDTHGSYEIDKILNEEFLNSYPFSRDDVLIVLGDFGVFWLDEPDKEERYFLDKFNSLPFTLCFIDGNHENFNRLYEFKTENKFGGLVSKCGENCYWLRRGEIYEICSKNIFTFGGAMSRDREFRVLNDSWWLSEIPSDDEMKYGFSNLENFIKSGKNIDLVLTHTAPQFLVESMGFDGKIDKTSVFLDRVFNLLKPKEWYFGHFHEDVLLKTKECKFRILYNEIVGVR